MVFRRHSFASRIFCAILAALLLLFSGCSLFKSAIEDPFSGKWIGLARLPMSKQDALYRIDIELLEASEQKYRISILADYYRPEGPAGPDGKRNFVWQTGTTASFTSALDDRTLAVSGLSGLALRAGKIAGEIELSNGTIFRTDDGKQYEGLKKELAKRTAERFPGAVFADQ